MRYGGSEPWSAQLLAWLPCGIAACAGLTAAANAAGSYRQTETGIIVQPAGVVSTSAAMRFPAAALSRRASADSCAVSAMSSRRSLWTLSMATAIAISTARRIASAP